MRILRRRLPPMAVSRPDSMQATETGRRPAPSPRRCASPAPRPRSARKCRKRPMNAKLRASAGSGADSGVTRSLKGLPARFRAREQKAISRETGRACSTTGSDRGSLRDHDLTLIVGRHCGCLQFLPSLSQTPFVVFLEAVVVVGPEPDRQTVQFRSP